MNSVRLPSASSWTSRLTGRAGELRQRLQLRRSTRWSAAVRGGGPVRGPGPTPSTRATAAATSRARPRRPRDDRGRAASMSVTPAVRSGAGDGRRLRAGVDRLDLVGVRRVRRRAVALGPGVPGQSGDGRDLGQPVRPASSPCRPGPVRRRAEAQLGGGWRPRPDRGASPARRHRTVRPVRPSRPGPGRRSRSGTGRRTRRGRARRGCRPARRGPAAPGRQDSGASVQTSNRRLSLMRLRRI